MLLAACREGIVPEVLRLLKKEKKTGRLPSFIDQEDPNGHTPLDTALRFKHLKVCEILVEKGGADPNRTSCNGTTPFMIASHGGHLELVRLFKEKGGADVNKSTPAEPGPPGGGTGGLERLTPLVIACQNGQVAVARYLAENGADVNALSGRGTTPLLTFCEGWREGGGGVQLEVVRLLLAGGARVNQVAADALRTALAPLLSS